MDKNKRLFPFRKHPVGDILGGKGKKVKRGMGILLSAALLFHTLPSGWLTVAASQDSGTGLCEHHMEHTADCGYQEAEPGAECSHEHTEECYKIVKNCIHEHMESCYPEETSGEKEASSSNAEEKQPLECSHVCSEGNGCITKETDCIHEHDESCGYREEKPGSPCAFECAVCSSETLEETDSETKTSETETEEEGKEPDSGQTEETDSGQECICGELCKEGSINPDCPVCSAEGADLSVCEGTAYEGSEKEEETTEVTEPEEAETEDTNLCAHHKEHTEDCGFVPATEGSEGSPCTYECRICPIEDLIAVLTDEVTADNADDVRLQLEEILSLFSELTEEEQEQVDISRCLELQEALDAANKPALAAETSGSLSDTLSWSLENSTLTIKGTGPMPDYGDGDDTPWSQNRQRITTVVIEGDVTSIGNNAFEACSSLATVTFPKNLKTIGEYAFYDCDQLTSIDIPEGVETIEKYAFSNCNMLFEVNLSEGLKNIGFMAFFNCSNLSKVTFRSVTAPTLGNYVFDNTNDALQIHVPIGAIGYDGENWPANKKVVKQDGTTTYVANLANAFAEANSGATVTLLADVTLADSLLIPSGIFTLDLNGKTVTALGTALEMLNSKTTLDIQDSSTGKTGTIQGGLSAGNWAGIELSAGTLNITGGTIQGTWAGIEIKSTANTELNVSGDAVLKCTEGMGLFVNSFSSGNEKIRLSGGTFTGGQRAISAESTQTLKELLAEGYAYANGDTLIVEGLESNSFTFKSVTVRKCDHTGEGVCEYTHIDGTTTHSMTCLACGYTETMECTYDENKSNGDNTTHTLTCSGCASTKTEYCSGGTATYTEKAECEICGGEYGELIKDTEKPIGEISIRTSKWNSFLNTITFGLFFKQTEQVTITGEDKESGVKSVSYYISDSGMSEDAVEALTEGWTDVENDTVTFPISDDKSCVVYAKITDNQGNMTYLSSDGMVFDGTAPSIEGVENGKTYCEPQIVTVRDENLESVTVNGKEQTLSDGSFTLDISFDVPTIVIEAADKAENITTVTINTGHDYGTDWKSDSNGHWRECACGDKSETVAHTEDSGSVTKPATETETGIRTYKCSVCGYVIRTEEIEKLPPSHKHSYGKDWKSDKSNHWHECVCGDKSNIAAHTEDSGSVTKPATETETGIRTYKCSVCGYVIRTEEIEKLSPSHKHSYGTDWKSDKNNHWHECICGDKSNIAAHTEDNGSVTKAPTETETGIRTYKCSVCGYVIRTEEIEKLSPSHKHSYGTDWKSDKSNHWHECVCGDKSNIAAHTEDSGSVTKPATETETGIRTYKCSVCGYVIRTEEIEKLSPSHKHSYGTDWKSDKNNHWHECVCGDKSDTAVHTEDNGSVTKPATETETGIRTYKCSVCGYVIRTEEIEKLSPSHKHSYGTDWKSDKNNHWHECVCGDKSDTAVHTEDNGSVTKPATETETGIRTYKCSVCGYVIRTEEIEKLPPSHKHSYGTDWKSDKSNHWHECVCGDKSNIAAHTEDNGSVTKAPTETEKGVRTYRCSVCGYIMRTEKIDKLPPSHKHSYGTGWKSDGNNHWHECACGDRSGESAHTEDSGSVTKAPTETEKGIRTYRCSVCGYVMRTEEIAKLPISHTHNYGTGWKSDSNNHWHECACGDRSGESAHTEDSGSVTKAPTETEKGVRTYRCSACGYVMRTEEIAKLSPSHTENNQPGDKKPDNNQSENPGADERPDSVKPGTSGTGEDKPEAGKPFIKDKSGQEGTAVKSGWNVIREETSQAEDGKTVIVDMNGSTVVPGDVLENIRGRDITIVFDIGNGMTWSVNGKDIREGKISDIDVSVQTDTEKIPVDIVNHVTGENYSIQISLAHEGEFGFTAVLSISLGKENAGLAASLYYYKESTGELEFICTDTIAEDGTVSLAFTHASDYVITVDAKQEEENSENISASEITETPESENTGNNEELPQTRQPWKPWWFVVIGGLVVVIGILCVVFVTKKKKEDAR